MPYVWPEPESSAAGLRTWGLVEAFQAAGHEVIMAAACRPNAALERVRARGIRAQEVLMNDAAFDQFLLDEKPDVVIFERFQTEERFGWRVESVLPEALRIIDTVDLYFLRRARELDPVLARTHPELAASTDFFRELAAIYRSDLSYLVSDFEENLLTSRFGVPAEMMQTLRFSYDARATSAPSYSQRAGFVFIGGFRHAPNADAVQYLHAEIWPRLSRRLPGVELRIFGSYPPREWISRDQPRTGFRVMGPAVNAIEELERARVNLAPLRFGAGIKGKISDGWQAGTPVVTTSIGAEGMSGGLPFGGVVVDNGDRDPEAFVEGCVRLYQDQDLWARSVANGESILRTHYDPSRNGRALVDRLQSAHHDRKELRARNFIGGMLRQNGARSTEYFSRWIALKEQIAKSSQ